MNVRLFISYCRDVILSVGCSIDDRDSGVLMADECDIVLTLSVACLIDDRDSGGVYNGQCIYRLPVNITK